MLDPLDGVVPAEAIDLIRDSLTRDNREPERRLVLIVVGFVLALWTASGAMNALMRGLNRVYDREETRSFVRQRLTALGDARLPPRRLRARLRTSRARAPSERLARHALELEGSSAGSGGRSSGRSSSPGLLAAFAAVLYLGPNVDHPRWRFLTPGARRRRRLAPRVGLFAVYVSLFGSYNKAWGSLAAVIVMLTWLWLSALALLLGAEINAEAERSRELRQGEPAEVELQAPAKA